MQIEKLTDSLGARVTGLDLSSPLDSDVHTKLHEAWLDYQLLVHYNYPNLFLMSLKKI